MKARACCITKADWWIDSNGCAKNWWHLSHKEMLKKIEARHYTYYRFIHQSKYLPSQRISIHIHLSKIIPHIKSIELECVREWECGILLTKNSHTTLYAQFSVCNTTQTQTNPLKKRKPPCSASRLKAVKCNYLITSNP